MRMKDLLSIVFLLLVPLNVDAYVPDRPIPYASRQLAVGEILIASANIKEGIFHEAVILLTSHSPSGDMGLIINRPSKYRVKDIYPGFSFAHKAGRLFIGGPVRNAILSVLVKSKSEVAGMTEVLLNIHHGFVKNNEGAGRYFSSNIEAARYYSGYAGWGAGQLVNEFHRGDWYILDADPAVVFDGNTDTMWQELMGQLGGRR
jgi:putative transcriptional regulator